MTFLANRLRDRVHVKLPIQDAGADAGFVRGYKSVGSIWAELKPVSSQSKGIAAFASYIRGTQVASMATHICTIRRTAVSSLGGNFAGGLGRGFNSQADLEILKSDYYIFRNRGEPEGQFTGGFNNEYNQTEGLIGNLFRILGYEDVDNRREYLRLRLEEIEEQGVGAQA